MSLNSVNDQSVVFVDFSGTANAEEGIGPAWIEKCQKENGKPVNNLANVLIALRCDPMLCDAIAWDEMQQSPYLKKPLDGADYMSFIARPLTDMLIPVQAAHHNEMMSPAVTELCRPP